MDGAEFLSGVDEHLEVRDSAGFEGRGGTNRAGFLSLISYPKSIPWINHRAQLFFLLFLKLLASWAYPPAENRFENFWAWVPSWGVLLTIDSLSGPKIEKISVPPFK
jgi:hypothetical protein